MECTSTQEQGEEDSFDSSDLEEQEIPAAVLVKTKDFGSFLNPINNHGCGRVYEDNFNGQKGEDTVQGYAQCLQLKNNEKTMAIEKELEEREKQLEARKSSTLIFTRKEIAFSFLLTTVLRTLALY